jgi:hypothetical protein
VFRLHVIVSAHRSTRSRWTLTVEALLLPDAQSAAPIWNLRGVLCNSWHHVELDWRNESDVGQVMTSEQSWHSRTTLSQSQTPPRRFQCSEAHT